jgi:nucleoside-diphosphate-sugar epimerase
MIDICVIGGDGFVGFSVCSELKKKKLNLQK